MKIGNLVNLQSIQKFCDSAKSQQNFQDSDAGVILARSLTNVDPRIFEKKYPDLALINSGVQADNTGGYAQRIQSLRVAEEGGFSDAGDMSGNKGKIGIQGEDSLLPVIERSAFSDWTKTQVEQSKLQNINLPSRYLESHNKIYMRELDQIGLVGKGVITEGLLNNSFYTATSSGSVLSSLTAQQMYDAYADLITDQRNAVQNTDEYMAKEVITPTRCLNILNATIYNPNAAQPMSVLKALQMNFPEVSFRGTFRADTEANGGNLPSASATVAFSTSDEALKFRVPHPLEIGEIVKTGSFDFKVDSFYRVAGIDVLEPAAGRILTGL